MFTDKLSCLFCIIANYVHHIYLSLAHREHCFIECLDLCGLGLLSYVLSNEGKHLNTFIDSVLLSC
uniref:Uncharacterized protein n=1 Tax=Arundo donax TaxID=35708 RepID=A0A0A8Z0I5_ARUDO